MIETARLRLRGWELRDRESFAALNADPEVMRHFPTLLGREQSDAVVARLRDRQAEDGYCFGVVQRKADGAFVGMVGLSRVRFADPGSSLDGAVEIGWRLGRTHWGHGYATEAALGWLGYGFGTLGLEEIVAFTVPANTASQAVMWRIGMREDPARGFEHPLLPEGHPLRPHLLFTAARPGAQVHADFRASDRFETDSTSAICVEA